MSSSAVLTRPGGFSRRGRSGRGDLCTVRCGAPAARQP